MAKSTNQPGDARRINVQCSCGKRLLASTQHAGKRVKCPACGQAVVVPTGRSALPVAATQQVVHEPEGMTKATFIALWSFLGVFTLGCVLFLVWHTHSSHQARIAAANERISQAVASANEWLSENSPLDGEAVEQTLSEALMDQVATAKGDGESVLSQVRQRREQLAEEARTEQAQRQATAIWDDAKRQIDSNRITEAISLLQKYVADPHATEKAEAQQLLAEAETAVSDMFAIDALIAMTNEDFGRVQTTTEIRDGKVTHPVLVDVRSETVKRNLEKAIQRREEIRIAEEKRREAERLAAIQRQRQEEERRHTAEQARLAEEQRRKAELAAKLAAIRNPPSVSFKDLTNFPEDYFQKRVKINSVWLHGGFDRDKDAGVFCVGVSSDDGKYLTPVLYGDDLTFIVSEAFGRGLDLIFEEDKKTGTNLCCEITKMGNTPVAKIYRIETLNRSGNVLNAYQDSGILGGAEPRQKPLKLADKGTIENPAAVSFKDLANFPEDYMQAFVRVGPVWLHGGFDRDKDAGIFCVGVSSNDGKYLTPVLYGDDLTFIVSEAFGRGLDLIFEEDMKTGTNLCCEISEIDNTPVARIYRIETLNRAGNVLNTYDDK